MLVQTGKAAVNAAVDWEFRRRYDADVGGHVYLDAFGLDHADRVWHDPSRWLPTLLALRRLRLNGDDVLVDIGAGKGAAVLVAASLPIKRVIGVEIADEFAATARENIAKNRSRVRAAEVEIVTADALEWPIPDDVTIIYLYAPLLGDLFARFMQRVFEAHDRAPRPLRVVSNYPFDHNTLMETGRVRVLDVAPAIWPRTPRWWLRGEVIVTYGVGPGTFPRPRGVPAPRAAIRHWSAPNTTRMALKRPGQAPRVSA